MAFKEELKEYQKKIDVELENILPNRSDDLSESYIFLKEYILRGGKRLRPILLIKAYGALTREKSDKILLPSLSVELFHCSTLAHDDIMDEDDLRRNKPSMHKLYEEFFSAQFKDKPSNGSIFSQDSLRFATSAGIIKGNIMLSLGINCITSSSFTEKVKNEAVSLYSDSYIKVNEGQLLDVMNEFRNPITKKDYITMASLKTANLIASSLEIGAVFSEASAEVKSLFREFGIAIALAFQLRDDLMDIRSDLKKGNTLGSDIRKGKKTVMMIHALEHASKEQKQFLESITADASDEEVKEAIALFEELGSIKECEQLADQYREKGKEILKTLKEYISEEGFGFFSDLCDYMTKREE